MQVDKGLVEEARVATELLQVRADIAVGDLGRFLHDIAQLTGQFEAAVQGVDQGCLDWQGRAAHAGPGQAGDDAFSCQHLFTAKHRHAQGGFKVLRANLDGCVGVLQ